MLTSLIIAYFLLHGGASALIQQHIEAASKGIDKSITAEPTKNRRWPSWIRRRLRMKRSRRSARS